MTTQNLSRQSRTLATVADPKIPDFEIVRQVVPGVGSLVLMAPVLDYYCTRYLVPGTTVPGTVLS